MLNPDTPYQKLLRLIMAGAQITPYQHGQSQAVDIEYATQQRKTAPHLASCSQPPNQDSERIAWQLILQERAGRTTDDLFSPGSMEPPIDPPGSSIDLAVGAVPLMVTVSPLVMSVSVRLPHTESQT